MRIDKLLKYARLTRTMANEFSKDDSTKVGAIALNPKSYSILSTGYNGFPRGMDETIRARWERPIKYQYVEHAERNLIYNAAADGISLEGATIIVTLPPCVDCARGIIQTQMKRVVTWRPEKGSAVWERWQASAGMSAAFFEEVGVEVVYLDDVVPQWHLGMLEV